MSFYGGSRSLAPEAIDLVFGPGEGASMIDRSLASNRRYVRSQLQLSIFRGHEKGRVLSASEALNIFGWEALTKVAEEGSFPLAASHDEPAATIYKRRRELGMSAERLAKDAGVTVAEITAAEREGEVVQIHRLERIAQAMALDERVIGHVRGAGGDTPLGVRLREVAQQNDVTRFTDRDVLQLAEAAWVVSRQVYLDELVNGARETLSKFKPSSDYRYKAYDRGEELAHETRLLLSLNATEPIQSLKSLSEERLRIPVTQQELSEHFAGATIANGSSRGVVLNERGMNENVRVRRMTLAHELGHLLWDPNTSLDSLKVHRYEDVQPDTRRRDPVEIRANAFAVNFLAPRAGVRRIMTSAASDVEGVAQVMSVYGISATAAKFHVKNMTQIQVDVPARELGEADHDWVGRENMLIDMFKPTSTPLSRRGKFAWHVAYCYRAKYLSADSAAVYLRCSADEIEANADFILEALK